MLSSAASYCAFVALPDKVSTPVLLSHDPVIVDPETGVKSRKSSCRQHHLLIEMVAPSITTSSTSLTTRVLSITMAESNRVKVPD